LCSLTRKFALLLKIVPMFFNRKAEESKQFHDATKSYGLIRKNASQGIVPQLTHGLRIPVFLTTDYGTEASDSEIEEAGF